MSILACGEDAGGQTVRRPLGDHRRDNNSSSITSGCSSDYSIISKAVIVLPPWLSKMSASISNQRTLQQLLSGYSLNPPPPPPPPLSLPFNPSLPLLIPRSTDTETGFYRSLFTSFRVFQTSMCLLPPSTATRATLLCLTMNYSFCFWVFSKSFNII